MNIFTKTKSYLKRYGALNLIRKVMEKLPEDLIFQRNSPVKI